MNFLNFNSKILKDDQPIIPASNRGLRYGAGIFETMKLREGSIIMHHEHFARLWKGLQLLQFDIPKLWSPEKFEEQILQLAKKNKLINARVRLTVFHGEGGLYDAKDQIPNYIMETIILPQSNGQLNENGMRLCTYEAGVKVIDSFSNIKHNNYLPYFMGALFAKKNQCNDALILNNWGNICDSTIANIFIIKDEKICTPPLSEGCIAGIMRKWLIEKIRELGFSVNEAIITKTDLAEADEVFLSNSIYNIRWVSLIENKSFGNLTVKKISAELAKRHPDEYC